jgi:hypothetical protein
MISSALPSLNAMATPEALVNAWARCAMTARSSGEAPRALLLAVLLAVSEAWVAIFTPSLRNSYFLSPRAWAGTNHPFKALASWKIPAWALIPRHHVGPRGQGTAAILSVVQKQLDRRKIQTCGVLPFALLGEGALAQ